MVSTTILYLWTLAFSFDLLKNFLFATFSLINQLPLNLYNFWSNDTYEWVSRILTCGLDAMLQLSNIRGVADGISSFSSVVCWWFISFCRCLWLKIWCFCCCGALGFDVVATVELLDLILLLLWSSWITTWQCLVSSLEFLIILLDGAMRML